MNKSFRTIATILAAAQVSFLNPAMANGSDADSGAHGAQKEKSIEAEPPLPARIEHLAPAEQYCSKVGDAATSAQIAQQRKALDLAQSELDSRIKTLSAKTEELRAWTKTREEFQHKATQTLIEIYAKMRPESAAPQLLAMNQFTAAAIIAKLPVKLASAVLSEMDAMHAARLSAVLAATAGIAEVKSERQKKD